MTKPLSLSTVIALALVFASADFRAAVAQPSDDSGQENQRERRDRRQGRGGGGRGMGGMFGGMGLGAGISRASLLRSEQVRTELSIDESQAATLEAAMDAYSDERRSARPDFSRFREMSEDERAAEMERVQKAAAELTRKTDETLALLLEPEQRTRLDQIVLQVQLKTNPLGAMKDEALRKYLGLTDEQITQLDGLDDTAREKTEEMRQKMMEQFQAGERPDMEKMREAGEALNKELAELAMNALTDDQKTQLQEQQGEAFEVDMAQLAPRGRGRRGFGGGFGFGGGREFGGGGGDGQGGGRRNRERRNRPEEEPAESGN